MAEKYLKGYLVAKRKHCYPGNFFEGISEKETKKLIKKLKKLRNLYLKN